MTHDDFSERDRSYRVRVTHPTRLRARRDIPAARVAYDPWRVVERGVIPAGSVVTATTDTNAGFRGIEVLVEHPDQPGLTAIVSTGAFDIVGCDCEED